MTRKKEEKTKTMTNTGQHSQFSRCFSLIRSDSNKKHSNWGMIYISLSADVDKNVKIFTFWSYIQKNSKNIGTVESRGTRYYKKGLLLKLQIQERSLKTKIMSQKRLPYLYRSNDSLKDFQFGSKDQINATSFEKNLVKVTLDKIPSHLLVVSLQNLQLWINNTLYSNSSVYASVAIKWSWSQVV